MYTDFPHGQSFFFFTENVQLKKKIIYIFFKVKSYCFFSAYLLSMGKEFRNMT